MNPEEFHRYWREDHANAVRRHARTIGAIAYVQHHSLETGLEAIVQEGRGCPPDTYDGVAVVTFESLEDMANKGAQPEALAAAQELADDERRFIDHSRSRIWFTEHVTII